ncbi:hypothetical protein VTN96DRAFT_10244 [Rasamsonia emersonii]
MEVTEELRKQKKHVANYFCHHEGITPWIHIRALMWSLVFQILRSKPDILLKDLTEIRHRITTCNKEDDDKALEDMFKTMDRVLQSFGGKQDVLYLIIDRLDNSEPQHLHEGLLNKFFNLVREAPYWNGIRNALGYRRILPVSCTFVRGGHPRNLIFV